LFGFLLFKLLEVARLEVEEVTASAAQHTGKLTTKLRVSS
jgi:hypothetical protein